MTGQRGHMATTADTREVTKRLGLLAYLNGSPGPLATHLARGDDAGIQGDLFDDAPTLPPDDQLADEGAEALERLQRRGISVLLPSSHPTLAATVELTPPPGLLFVRGALPKVPMAAVVGARAVDQYGEEQTARVVDWLGRLGYGVVSGGAMGVDALAHERALGEGLPTVAVLGTGVDVPYPRCNEALLDRIAAHGAVVSEYPPGTESRRHHFPRRNRIIAAMGRATIVTRAKRKSGSLITAGIAREMGRPVGAVVGRIGDELSEGPHQLVRLGAVPLMGSQDVARLLGGSMTDAPAPPPRAPVDLDGTQGEVLAVIRRLGPVHIDEIHTQCGLSLDEVLPVVLELELLGVVTARGGSYVAATPS